MTQSLPRTVDEITPAWLAENLAGIAAQGRNPEVLTATRIGQSQSFTGSTLYRLRLWDPPPADGAPTTLVAKFSPQDPAMARMLFAANAQEVAIYRQFAAYADPIAPRHCFAAIDPARHSSLLLLQDLGHGQSVPFAQGLGLAEALDVTEVLAAFHARWWQSAALSGLDDRTVLDSFNFCQCWQDYRAAAGDLLPDIVLPADFLALGDHLSDHLTPILDRLRGSGPVTCLHGDLQADNLIFLQDGSVRFIDWQMSGQGRGVGDLTYLLISSMSPADRRAHERHILSRYHQALSARGVGDYSHAACSQDYLNAAATKVIMTVVATVLFDNGTAEKRAWRRADLLRLLAFCEDHALTQADFPR